MQPSPTDLDWKVSASCCHAIMAIRIPTEASAIAPGLPIRMSLLGPCLTLASLPLSEQERRQCRKWSVAN